MHVYKSFLSYARRMQSLAHNLNLKNVFVWKKTFILKKFVLIFFEKKKAGIRHK